MENPDAESGRCNKLKTMEYEVTIGIPVYNVEKYIRESLESALAQTFPYIEFLICDDCGTDSSIAIVEEFQNSHPRGKDIRIVNQPRNMGSGCARNKIIAEAKGRYVFFMDSDDLLSPNAIELLYDQSRKFDADIVFGSMEKVLLYDNGRRVKNADYNYQVFLHEDEFASWVYTKYNRLQASTCNFLIRLDIFRNNDIQFKPINYWDDFTIMMDLPTYVVRVVLLPDVTYHYMCHYGSLSNYQRRDIIQKEEILQTMQAINMIKDNSERIKNKPYFSRRMLKVMMTCYYICCTILDKGKTINPSFEKKELRDFMKYPISFSHLLSFKSQRCSHVMLYLLGVISPSLSIITIRMTSKIKRIL